MLFSVAVHYFVFPPLYNKWIILKEWDYVGTTAWLDRLENKVKLRLGGWFVVTLKLAFLATGLKFYHSACVHWNCWPF
jgi:hypothetical protein